MNKTGRQGLALDMQFAGDSYAPAAVRRFLEELSGVVSPEVVEDLQLACTELVTNSIRHSGAGPDQKVSVRIQLSSDRVRVEVRDQGRGFKAPAGPIQPDATRGRGLLVIDRLSSDWGVSTDRGTMVWFEIPLGEPPGLVV